MTKSDSRKYLLNHYMIKNVEDIVAFLGLKGFTCDNFYKFSCTRDAQVTLTEKLSTIVSVEVNISIY